MLILEVPNEIVVLASVRYHTLVILSRHVRCSKYFPASTFPAGTFHRGVCVSLCSSAISIFSRFDSALPLPRNIQTFPGNTVALSKITFYHWAFRMLVRFSVRSCCALNCCCPVVCLFDANLSPESSWPSCRMMQQVRGHALNPRPLRAIFSELSGLRFQTWISPP